MLLRARPAEGQGQAACFLTAPLAGSLPPSVQTRLSLRRSFERLFTSHDLIRRVVFDPDSWVTEVASNRATPGAPLIALQTHLVYVTGLKFDCVRPVSQAERSPMAITQLAICVPDRIRAGH